MEYTVTWGGYPQDVVIETRGRATIDDVKQLIHDVMTDPNYRPGIKVLLDHSQLDAGSVRPEDVQALAEFAMERREQIGETAIAVVAPNQREYALSRSWRTHAQPELGNLVAVFYTRSAAEDWLAGIPEQL